MKQVAIVIPVLNEASVIGASLLEIARHIEPISNIEFTILVVDDGSEDMTIEELNKIRPTVPGARVCVLRLSRHYGKEAAIHAGLEKVRNFDAAIVMDCDLQHPPALILEMLKFWQQGSLVVEGVKRSRGNEHWLRNLYARIYYGLFHMFTGLNIGNATDFKLLDKEIINIYCSLPETNRFFRGLIRWIGGATTQIPFDVPATVKKKSSWQKLALIRYAVSSISSFTSYPLQIVTILGGITFVISLVIGGIALFDKFTGNAVDGFTTVILLILIIGSVLMFSLGLIGIYIGKIFDEIKRRPNFIVDQRNSTLRDDNL